MLYVGDLKFQNREECADYFNIKVSVLDNCKRLSKDRYDLLRLINLKKATGIRKISTIPVHNRLLTKKDIVREYHIGINTLNDKLDSIGTNYRSLEIWLDEKKCEYENRKFTVLGVTYKSKTDARNAFGLDFNTLENYIQQAKGSQQVLDSLVLKAVQNHRDELTYKGRIYPSIKAVYKEENIPYGASKLFNTYKQEYPDLSLELFIQEYKIKKLLKKEKRLLTSQIPKTSLGERYLKSGREIGRYYYNSLTNASEYLGIDRNALERVCKKTNSAVEQEALIQEILDSRKEDTKYFYKGKQYAISELEKLLHMSRSNINKCDDLAKQEGISFEESIDKYKNRRSITVLGVRYATNAEACKALDMHTYTFQLLEKQANDENRSLDSIIRDYQQVQTRGYERYKIVAFGTEYSSIQKLADAMYLGKAMLQKALRDVTTEEGVNKILLNKLCERYNEYFSNQRLNIPNIVNHYKEYIDDKGMCYYTVVYTNGKEEILSNKDLIDLKGIKTKWEEYRDWYKQ